VLPLSTCRSCLHADPILAEENAVGVWVCHRHNRQLTTEEQVAGCHDHLYLSCTVNGAKVVDQDTVGTHKSCNWVQYQKADGTTFVNSPLPSAYRSHELAGMPWDLVRNPTIEKLKTHFDGTVTTVSPDHARRLWAQTCADAVAHGNRKPTA
jgi:hypothetical protein